MPQIQTVAELTFTAVEVDDAECALLTLEFLSQQTLEKPSQPLQMDEGGMVALLGIAAQTGNAALSNKAWSLLTRSLGPQRTKSSFIFCMGPYLCISRRF